MQSTLQGLTENLNAAMGEGYNEERKKGMQEQIDYLGGEMAKEQQEAYKSIGQWKASLENEREKAMRDAVQSAKMCIRDSYVPTQYYTEKCATLEGPILLYYRRCLGRNLFDRDRRSGAADQMHCQTDR